MSRLIALFHVLRFYATIILAILTGVAWLFHLAGVTQERWGAIEYLCFVPILLLLLLYTPDIIKRVRKHSEIIEETEPIEPEEQEPRIEPAQYSASLAYEIQHLENPCSGERRAGFELAKQIISSIIRERI